MVQVVLLPRSNTTTLVAAIAAAVVAIFQNFFGNGSLRRILWLSVGVCLCVGVGVPGSALCWWVFELEVIFKTVAP